MLVGLMYQEGYAYVADEDNGLVVIVNVTDTTSLDVTCFG